MLKARDFFENEKLFCSDLLIPDPIVSVIMPTYCRGDNGMLARAIDTVLAQSFKSFELIIVDDGSVDATQQVVKEYLRKDRRIVYIRNDANCGMPGLRVNQGLMHARGKYIAYQFDDDQWTENALKLLSEELEKQETPALVYGKCHLYANGESAYLETPFNYSRLVNDNFIANNSVLHSREIFEQYGMYDCHLVMRRLCDWELWLRWAKYVPFIFLDKVTSIVTAEVEGSLGKTVPLRFDHVRKRMGIAREQALTPERFGEYDIEDLSYLSDPVEQETVYRELVLPWKQIHYGCTGDEFQVQGGDGRKRLICTKCEYDSSVDIMIRNYTDRMQDAYHLAYFPDNQITYEDFSDGDIFLIARSISLNVLDIVRRLQQDGRDVTIIYYMDDNLFQYHQVDPSATYLLPGSEGYETLKELVTRSDLVVVYNEETAREIRKDNARILIAKTNIPEKYLPAAQEDGREGPFRIAFMGGGARKAEFSEIEGELLRLGEKYGNQIEFYFYGYIPEALKQFNKCKVAYVPFSNAYYQYLNAVSRQRFDLLLCPLYDGAFNRCKSPIKFLEAVCCGAVGVFSEVPVYGCVQEGVTGYKIRWGESWFERLSAIIDNGREPLREILKNARQAVLEEFSTESQLEFFRYITRTGELHHALKGRTILFACHSCYCAGAESLILRHAQLAKQGGANVLFALPEAIRGVKGELLDMLREAGLEVIYLPYVNYVEVADCDCALAREEGEQIAGILQARSVGLIHNCTLMPALSYAADRLGIPQVTSAYQGLDGRGYTQRERYFAPTVIHSDSVKEASLWMNKYRVFGTCIGNVIPECYFRPIRQKPASQVHVGMIGTFQPRKNQLGAVRAAALLSRRMDVQFYLYGYSKFYRDYFDSCRQEAKKNGIEDKIQFPGFVESTIGSFVQDGINIFLCASLEESIPQSMREAMAMGIPVVSTPVGNVPELVVDGETGYLARGFAPENIAEALERCAADIRSGAVEGVLRRAQQRIRKECSELAVAQRLFRLYKQAFQIKGLSQGKAATEPEMLPLPDKRNSRENPLPPLPPGQDMIFSGNIEHVRRYRVFCSKDQIQGVGVVFASEEGNCTGSVQMNLFYRGYCIRKSRMGIEQLRLGGWTCFKIAPLDWCGGKELVVELVFEYAPGSGRLGVYENRAARTLPYRVLKKLGFAMKGRNILWAHLG